MPFKEAIRIERIEVPNCNAVRNLRAHILTEARSKLLGRCIDSAYVVRVAPAISAEQIDELLPICDFSLATTYNYVDVPMQLTSYEVATKTPLLGGVVTRLISTTSTYTAEFDLAVPDADVPVRIVAAITSAGQPMPAIGEKINTRIVKLEYAANSTEIHCFGERLVPSYGPRGLFSLSEVQPELLAHVRDLLKQHQEHLVNKTSGPAYAEKCRLYAEAAWHPVAKVQPHLLTGRDAKALEIGAIATKGDADARHYYADLHNTQQLILYPCVEPKGAVAIPKKLDESSTAMAVVIQSHLETMLAQA